ncbi:hypothetical protein A2716_00675 [candidate division WWE3 bacterium RIFCSPHIGHO2_01_FULL_40_23]|uniref:Uncharacterized protein n=1 Tax=candidate division WWE3 bacterium RIFCSPLOWO2_01_FULL_41_18 TaxID=1802625 RepID=A0A1F4VEX1_UNCKA|nr:MAG: hypothetical protein A2716_00675 [candidate division WWE3 bacterium RIFCSPHIGHO2_01_FULL_40_23]OGC55508.1 MAG: hypothetical protein A3A78_00945 [candidate division WWE3 bacterium RIFCSPLOWO2_01_FULL_41_18]
MTVQIYVIVGLKNRRVGTGTILTRDPLLVEVRELNQGFSLEGLRGRHITLTMGQWCTEGELKIENLAAQTFSL